MSGETERAVRERYQEFYGDPRMILEKAPLGNHYKINHRESHTSSSHCCTLITGQESLMPGVTKVVPHHFQYHYNAAGHTEGLFAAVSAALNFPFKRTYTASSLPRCVNCPLGKVDSSLYPISLYKEKEKKLALYGQSKAETDLRTLTSMGLMHVTKSA